VGPRQLPALRPDVIVVMNRIYLPEITAQVRGLGLEPELHAL
jgi:hypothetical protein